MKSRALQCASCEHSRVEEWRLRARWKSCSRYKKHTKRQLTRNCMSSQLMLFSPLQKQTAQACSHSLGAGRVTLRVTEGCPTDNASDRTGLFPTSCGGTLTLALSRCSHTAPSCTVNLTPSPELSMPSIPRRAEEVEADGSCNWFNKLTSWNARKGQSC
jgi:hypothetical protein